MLIGMYLCTLSGRYILSTIAIFEMRLRGFQSCQNDENPSKWQPMDFMHLFKPVEWSNYGMFLQLIRIETKENVEKHKTYHRKQRSLTSAHLVLSNHGN